MNDTNGRGPLSYFYDVVLSIAAGFSLGFFGWLIGDRLWDGDTLPLWPFAVVGVPATFGVVWGARRRRGHGGWVHLLWIPVVAFLALMTLVVLALRSFT